MINEEFDKFGSQESTSFPQEIFAGGRGRLNKQSLTFLQDEYWAG